MTTDHPALHANAAADLVTVVAGTFVRHSLRYAIADKVLDLIHAELGLAYAPVNVGPESPHRSGPGAICGDCGHWAVRHVNEAKPGCGGVADPCACTGFLWNGYRYDNPSDPDTTVRPDNGARLSVSGQGSAGSGGSGE
jgi:hypothetical protein